MPCPFLDTPFSTAQDEQSRKRIAFQHMPCQMKRNGWFRHEDMMSRQTSTRGAGSRLGRTETVSIRLDPRLNYLCELAARSQRRTKSSFIEATIDEKIQSTPINTWRDQHESESIGDRAEYLWHIRECQRLVSLGFVAPHLMTFEEQQIWALIRENGFFWRGTWRNDVWYWDCDESSIVRDRVDEHWNALVAVAHGDEDPSTLPKWNRVKAAPPSTPGQLDDEIPF
jgi:hypothetical protein